MIRKYIDNIGARISGWFAPIPTTLLLRIAYIPGALIAQLLWLLCIGRVTGALIYIQAILLAIQITATVLWMRRR